MKTTIRQLIRITLPLLTLCACVTPPPTDQDVHSADTIKRFFQKPQDPRRYGLTVYQSQHGPVFSGSQRLHDFQTAQTDFAVRGSSLPIILVKGRKLELTEALPDTGSRDSWITMDAGALLAAQPLGPPPYRRLADHVAETEPGIAAYISKLRIEDLHIENLIAYVRVPFVTLGPIARGATDPQPGIVLGFDLLRAFSFIRFDYPERCVYFSSDRKYETSQARTLAAPAYKRIQGTPAVNVLLDGTNLQAIVDTGGDFELAWNQPEGSVIRQLFINDLALLDVHVTNSENLHLGYSGIPRIGTRLLRKFAVILDNKQRRIIFERPAGSVTEPAKEEKPAPRSEAWIPR